MGVNHGRADVLVAQQLLNSQNVAAGLEHVRIEVGRRASDSTKMPMRGPGPFTFLYPKSPQGGYVLNGSIAYIRGV